MSVDFQRQIDTATAYFLAGERCSVEMTLGEYGVHSIDAPTITNYAFSVELALKLLHSISKGARERGHDLVILFNGLPGDVTVNLPHLGECVAKIGQYFVDWRYPYERDFLAGSVDNVRRAFIECYREIRRLRPDIASVYERNWGSFNPSW